MARDKRRRDDDDDGRTIADMSGVEAPSLWRVRRPPDRRPEPPAEETPKDDLPLES